MFYITLCDTSPGWGDLASIIGYLLIIGFGIVFASIAEAAAFLINTKK